MLLAPTIERFDMVLPVWNMSDLVVLSLQDISRIALPTIAHRRQFECSKEDYHEYEYEWDSMLLSHGLTRAWISRTGVIASRTPKVIESILHGMLLNLFSTVHMTEFKVHHPAMCI